MKRIILAILASVLLRGSADAAITLTSGEWSTTFNCADWAQTVGQTTLSCDGLEEWNDSSTANGNVSKINASGDMSTGGGAKGFRVAIGNGVNVLASFFNITFPAGGLPEVWVRLYQRYPSGFTWSSMLYLKLFYIYQGGLGAGLVDQQENEESGAGVVLYKNGGTGAGVYHISDHTYCVNEEVLTNFPWSSVMTTGSNLGDGVWHSYEIHLKKDTGGYNGVFQLWIDGVLRNNHHDIHWDGNNFTHLSINANQNSPNNGAGDVYIDYDDIAVSTNGYIGPLGGSPPAVNPVLSPGVSISGGSVR